MGTACLIWLYATKYIEPLFPVEKGYHLFMHFDFGDDWVFKITRGRNKAATSGEGPYPRVIEHIGKNPEQYPLCDE